MYTSNMAKTLQVPFSTSSCEFRLVGQTKTGLENPQDCVIFCSISKPRLRWCDSCPPPPGSSFVKVEVAATAGSADGKAQRVEIKII